MILYKVVKLETGTFKNLRKNRSCLCCKNTIEQEGNKVWRRQIRVKTEQYFSGVNRAAVATISSTF